MSCSLIHVLTAVFSECPPNARAVETHQERNTNGVVLAPSNLPLQAKQVDT